MRPQVSERLAQQLALERWGWPADSASPLAGYDDTNLRLQAASGDTCVFKAHNAGDSVAEDQYAEAQNALLSHLAAEGFPVPAPLPLRQASATGGDAYTLRAAAEDGKVHAMRMLTWLPGTLLAEVAQSAELYRQLGALLARVNRALQRWDWQATGVLRRRSDWNIQHLAATYARVRPALLELEGIDVPLLDGVVSHFEAATAAAGSQLRQCIIHSDANERNVLVDAVAAAAAAQKQQQPGSADGAADGAAPAAAAGAGEGGVGGSSPDLVTGLIDWGDACWQWLAGEPAIAAVYMMLLDANANDPLPAAAALVCGYESELALTGAERRMLRTLCMGRLAQSLSLGAYSALQQPDNREYLLGTQRNGWRLLRTLWGMSDEDFTAAVCPSPDVA